MEEMVDEWIVEGGDDVVWKIGKWGMRMGCE